MKDIDRFLRKSRQSCQAVLRSAPSDADLVEALSGRCSIPDARRKDIWPAR